MSARPSALFAAISFTASVGCSASLDAPGSTFVVPPSFERYLQPSHPQAHSQFGHRLALSDSALAVTAPFEVASGDPVIPEGASDTFAPDAEGATYLFDLSQPTAAPVRIVAINAERGDSKLQSASLSVAAPVTFTNLPAMNVALSDDWLAIGVAGEDSALQPGVDPTEAEANNDAENAGAVYVYARSKLAAGDLTPAQYIKAPNLEPDDYFGISLALVGTQLFVGAPGEDGGSADDRSDNSATQSGAVYVYTLRDNQFVFDQYLKEPAPIQSNQLFGFSLSADGDLLAVGAPLDSSASSGVGGAREDMSSVGLGAAYLYRNREGTWQFDAYLKPAEAQPESGFGWSVRVDSGRVAIAAPGAATCPDERVGVGVNNRGTVYTFEQTGSGWSVDRCLAPATHNMHDFFGASLALIGDRLMVGAGWDDSGRADQPQDDSRPYSGAAYLEARTDSDWRQRAYLKAPKPGDNDVFGVSAELNARFAVLGAAQRSANESGEPSAVYGGAVYVFDPKLDASSR